MEGGSIHSCLAGQPCLGRTDRHAALTGCLRCAWRAYGSPHSGRGPPQLIESALAKLIAERREREQEQENAPLIEPQASPPRYCGADCRSGRNGTTPNATQLPFESQHSDRHSSRRGVESSRFCLLDKAQARHRMTMASV